MYAARRNSAPWAMLTVRIRPKINVNPDATTNIRPAKVIPSRRVTTNSPGSSIAAPDGVPVAKNNTQQSTNTIGMPTAMAGSRCLHVAGIQFPLWCDHPCRSSQATVRTVQSEVQCRTSDIARFVGGGPNELDRTQSRLAGSYFPSAFDPAGTYTGRQPSNVMPSRHRWARNGPYWPISVPAMQNQSGLRMNAAASVRDRTCSFIKMLLTWFLTVNRLRSRTLAISAFDRPFASSSAMSASRGVEGLERRCGTVSTERQDLGDLG